MPYFAVESLNNGLGNLYIPMKCITVLGGNRERISNCVLIYKVFCVFKFPLSETLLYDTLLHVRSLACLT